MCGIAGLVDLNSRPADTTALRRMCDLLEHRGPDDQGMYVNCSAALGQRRLSIIDLASGQQPMSNEDGTIWLTFNGEIYNYRELRKELTSRGHRFATDSDTETIVHAYEEYGEDCVHHLRGMFAFAVWDTRQQRLLMARDRAGKKPLFYTIIGGQFVFSSELQSLAGFPGFRRDISPQAVDDFLTYGYVPPPGSIFQGVHKLPPGCLLTLTPNTGQREPQIRRYWQLDYSPKLRFSCEDEALDAFTEVLTEAVRLRMVSDVPIGALLSGGIDSSLVVALMSGLGSESVETFSIGFEDQGFNELPYARMVAERYGTRHHEFIVRPDAVEILPDLVRHYGEPFADSSAVPSYYVSRLTRQHVTVALNGDGGDESFAGYDRYLGSIVAERYRRLPAILRKRVIEPTLSLVPESLPARNRLRQARRFVANAAEPEAVRYSRWVSQFSPERRQQLYTSGFCEQLGSYQAETLYLEEASRARERCDNGIDRLLALDVETYLPSDLLVKMDIASMANSLEVRSPFLDHKVMEFAARLPAQYKLRGRQSKYLLRRLGRRLIPPGALNRRKMGFGVPLARWFRNELQPMLHDVVLSDRALQRGYFNPDYLRGLVQDHTNSKTDHSFQLWALLWLELWHREFYDAPAS